MNEQIAEILKEMKEDTDFAASEDFIEDVLLDSYDIVNLVGILEDTFGVEISGRDIVPENFSSVESIAAMLGKYR